MTTNGGTGTVPDSAMATGNDEATPGEMTDETPLDPAERALLAALEQPATPVVDQAVEESPAAAAAVDDGTPLPLAESTGDDALAPRFREPSD